MARRRDRRVLAPAVLFAAAVVALAVVAAGCSGDEQASTTTTTATDAPETTTTTEAPLSAGKQLFVYVPSVGDCFDRRQLDEKPTGGSKQTEIVLKLECSLPHTYEVFDVIAFPSTKDYPGETVLRDFAKKNCTRGFEAFVGRSYELSDLEVSYVVPTADEWGPGREKVGCTLYDARVDPTTNTPVRLAGSMRGSGR